MAVNPIDHWVKHKSTLHATKDEQVELFVRERDGTPSGPPANRKAVLMLHGRSVPTLAGYDLQHTSYAWGQSLAQAGYDVFMMDLQGSGRSPRPRMEDPCNVNPSQQSAVTPPLSGPRTPTYPFVLSNSQTDQDELGTVVDYIRSTRGVSKVAFIGWSAAAFAMGPYAIKNPLKVESLFLLAPIFPPLGPSNPPTLPAPGFPTHVLTRGFEASWGAQVHCANQREPGMFEVVWSALMENDPIGRTWGKVDAATGKPVGVSRFRNFVTWGWNNTTAGQGGVLGGAVPVLIVHGEFDTTANTPPPSPGPALDFHVPALYDAVTGAHKLLVTAKCAGHSMPWEGQHKNLHNLSKHWLKQLKVEGKTQGRFIMAEDGTFTQVP
ncbi:alpha/beta fold hydrolase [Streptomyces turgidiscabies]|uniref:Hydrolase, alpha/beta domain protein n=1 Tax=Streptomyces turgidiscabies (strain Car8) TaxID=698760 RepID=L7F7N7_STRT8|nr:MULTISPECIES: alpha/beta fold hydrolase [Streptomyces]ELP67056.1 hydrolase, alpha/beta domain protein [Streptomyces turgidiscabies Car8]MDX3496001.1 alpha/beta fold hydrolase [Streptomyces turgidiscabies]GAQ72510.1 alpha/beta hydrolase family protein [Streptomyces turgidiscabies]